MNAKQLLVAVTMLAAAGSTFAQSREAVAPDANFMSAKSRTEVTADLNQAQANGALVVRDDTYPMIAKQPTMRSRAEVRSQIMPSTSKKQPTLDIYFG